MAALAARVERLDAHSGELARAVLAVIGRVDDLERSDLETRLDARIERVARDVRDHDGDHWRQGR